MARDRSCFGPDFPCSRSSAAWFALGARCCSQYPEPSLGRSWQLSILHTSGLKGRPGCTTIAPGRWPTGDPQVAQKRAAEGATNSPHCVQCTSTHLDSRFPSLASLAGHLKGVPMPKRKRRTDVLYRRAALPCDRGLERRLTTRLSELKGWHRTTPPVLVCPSPEVLAENWAWIPSGLRVGRWRQDCWVARSRLGACGGGSWHEVRSRLRRGPTHAFQQVRVGVCGDRDGRVSEAFADARHGHPGGEHQRRLPVA